MAVRRSGVGRDVRMNLRGKTGSAVPIFGSGAADVNRQLGAAGIRVTGYVTPEFGFVFSGSAAAHSRQSESTGTFSLH